MAGTGTRKSMASWTVHLPVPFCWASSTIMSRRRPAGDLVFFLKNARRDLDQKAAEVGAFHSRKFP